MPCSEKALRPRQWRDHSDLLPGHVEHSQVCIIVRGCCVSAHSGVQGFVDGFECWSFLRGRAQRAHGTLPKADGMSQKLQEADRPGWSARAALFLNLLDDEWPESIFHHVGSQSASYPVSVQWEVWSRVSWGSVWVSVRVSMSVWKWVCVCVCSCKLRECVGVCVWCGLPNPPPAAKRWQPSSSSWAFELLVRGEAACTAAW